jgi:hypothetical protein
MIVPFISDRLLYKYGDDENDQEIIAEGIKYAKSRSE